MTSNQQDYFGKPIAAHVPDALVRTIDFVEDPIVRVDPFAFFRRLRDEPPMVYNRWSQIKGQCWLPTRAEIMREILLDTERFSSEKQAGFSQLIGEDWLLGAVEMDPPQHTKIRGLMLPWVSPKAVAQLSEHVRARAVELIEQVKDKGRCEFMSEFGVPFPISIFMELMGLPREHTATFLDWTADILHGETTEDVRQAARKSADYLRQLGVDRRANPQDDIATKTVMAQIDGNPLTEDEIMGIYFVLFTGGLDTVAASLGFYFWHLATHPELQQRLRANPADIPDAVEEFLRAFSPVQALRRATRDTELGGVQIKKDDWICMIYALGSLDPHEYENPDSVDLSRTARRHFGFGFGPHLCLGNHLARRELQVALEEWTQRLPVFRLVEGAPIETHGGNVFGVDRLELRWD